MPPSLTEWLPEDHLAWFVIDAVDQMDLSGFRASYRADGWGHAGGGHRSNLVGYHGVGAPLPASDAGGHEVDVRGRAPALGTEV